MSVKTIWHLGAWNLNYGDRALQAATQKIFRDRYSGHINFVSVDTQKTCFTPQLINKMNAEADMLLIGGGGLIFHRPMDKSRSGWQFNIAPEDIDKINIPICVYGIGYNKFPYDNHVFPNHMWRSLQAVINKAHTFSVRNNGTLEVLESFGTDTSRVTVVPDSAMFLDPFPFEHNLLIDSEIKIGLNWSTDRWHQRFSSVDYARAALKTTLNVLREQALERDARVFYIEHLLPNETNKHYKEEARGMFCKVMTDVKHCVLYDHMHQDLYPPFDYLAPFFVDIYRQMDVMLAMRGHANILAFGQYTPFVGLGEHNKVKWFLDDVNQHDMLVKLNGDTENNIKKLRYKISQAFDDRDAIRESLELEKSKQEIIKNNFVDLSLEAL